MKAGNMRLSDFVNDLQQARETKQSDSDDHPAMGADDNFVRIMTMYKSKGLEFPVVILMDLQKSIRGKRNDDKLRMNVSSSGGALGLYLPAVQRRRHSIMDSQGKDAFDIQALRKNISEGTRLLYVAMTRAGQRRRRGSLDESDAGGTNLEDPQYAGYDHAGSPEESQNS